MQISSFNGGLNKRVSPYLMQSNEGVKYSNIDTTSGALVPLKENKDLNSKIKPSFTYFNNHWIDSDENRDYVKFQDKIFYSNGQTRPQWSPDGFTWYGLGIDKPDKLVLGVYSAVELSEYEFVTYDLIVTSGDVAANLPNNIISLYLEDMTSSSGSNPFPKTLFEIVLSVPHPTLPCNTVVTYNVDNRNVHYLFASVICGLSVNSFIPYIRTKDDCYQLRKSRISSNNTWFQLENVFVARGFNSFEFKQGEEYSYTAVWKQTSTEKIFIEQFSARTPTNSNIFGLKLLKKDGYTLRLFRNGFEVTLRENSTHYFDSNIPTSLSFSQAFPKFSSVKYVCTFYSTLSGLESVPSDFASVPDTLSGGSFISITLPTTEDNQVDFLRIYRLGGSLTQYSLVAQVPITQRLYTDDKKDSEIDGAILNSYNNLPAPDKLRYLTLYNTILFGSIGDKLYYTDVASPFVWSGFNFIDFDDIITGIGGTANGLLVFTKHSTYIVTGTSPSTFSKYLLSSGVGCVLHKSIQYLQNTLLWLSEDSICASNGGTIQILSRDKLDTLNLSTPRCSAVLNDVYYLSHNNGTLIADFRFGLVFRESDKVYYGLAVNDNSLYGVEINDKFVEINKGENPLSITYTSPKFSDGSISTIKTYKDIYFHSSGDLNVKVFIDDILVGDKDLDKGFSEVKVSSANTRGYSIQFEVSGTGTLNEIEYKVEGRQNGR